MKEFIVRKKITINAQPSEVWDALTNPEKTKKYFFNCRVISDWKPGSEITFKGRLFFFKKIKLKGKIIHIEPNRLLQYSLKNEHSNSVSMVTDHLDYENGKTILKITDDVGQEEGVEQRYQQSDKGWDKILKGLKKQVEKNQTT